MLCLKIPFQQGITLDYRFIVYLSERGLGEDIMWEEAGYTLTLTGQDLFVELVMAVHRAGIRGAERTVSTPHDGATAELLLRLRQVSHIPGEFLADPY